MTWQFCPICGCFLRMVEAKKDPSWHHFLVCANTQDEHIWHVVGDRMGGSSDSIQLISREKWLEERA